MINWKFCFKLLYIWLFLNMDIHNKITDTLSEENTFLMMNKYKYNIIYELCQKLNITIMEETLFTWVRWSMRYTVCMDRIVFLLFLSIKAWYIRGWMPRLVHIKYVYCRVYNRDIITTTTRLNIVHRK